MRTLTKIVLLGMILAMGSCSQPAPKKNGQRDPLPAKYENELFSVSMPNGWVCDSSGWNGLEAFQNSVEIANPNGSYVWLHFVKAFMPFKWKDVGEAKDMAISSRALSGENTELIDVVDSVMVGGYPASVLYFANYEDNDTIIQKQYVTYLEDSHIVMYFNENFRLRDWEWAQELGDKIIGTIKLKKVTNPLENDSILKKSMEKGLEEHPVEEKYLDAAKRAIGQ